MDKDLKFIIEKSLLFNKMMTDEDILFEQVNKLSQMQIIKLLDFYKEPKPISITRYVILKMLLNHELIDAEKMKEIKSNFHSKNVNYFKKYLEDDVSLSYIANYETLRPLSSWNNFGILYDYFYINEIKHFVKDTYEDISKNLMLCFNLSGYCHKIINFQGARNNGSDTCWISLYPAKFKHYNDAAQIYCKVEAGKLYAGLYIDQDLKKKIKIKGYTGNYEKVECKSYNDVLDCISKIIALEKRVNNKLKPDAIPDFKIENKSLKLEKIQKNIIFETLGYHSKQIVKSELILTNIKYSESDFLNEVFIDESNYRILRNLLENKKNLIIQGAPGVGKTFSAKRLAYSIIGEINEEQITQVQFHQNYGYEDFIMGYRPDDNHFYLHKGPFYSFCKKAEENPHLKFFFIIDEINRGNISKIFGELLSLIEADRRGQSASLMYNNEKFCVPENLYIIGLMNTADRSIAMIDYALRRRFAFYDFQPAFESEGFINYLKKINNPKFNVLIEAIKKLNLEILEDSSLGECFRIGHSYFYSNNEVTDLWLNCVVNYEIIPLLHEYWFDDEKTFSRWENELREIVRL